MIRQSDFLTNVIGSFFFFFQSILDKLTSQEIAGNVVYIHYSVIQNIRINVQGPVVTKRRYLNELVKGHFVNCFSGFNIQFSDIFC